MHYRDSIPVSISSYRGMKPSTVCWYHSCVWSSYRGMKPSTVCWYHSCVWSSYRGMKPSTVCWYHSCVWSSYRGKKPSTVCWYHSCVWWHETLPPSAPLVIAGWSHLQFVDTIPVFGYRGMKPSSLLIPFLCLVATQIDQVSDTQIALCK